MKKLLSTLVLLLHITASVAQSRQQCSLPTFRSGGCVPIRECPFTDRLSGIIHDEDVQEFQNRVFACSSFGKKMMCCENIGVTSQPVVTANRFTSRATIKTTRYVPITTTFQPPLAIIQPETQQQQEVDPLHHPNYKFFSNLRCGSLYANRIAHGNNSDLFEFPWAARLGYKNKIGELAFDCGATLISDFYVLTAAHCIVGIKETIKLTTVRLGDFDISTEIDCDPNGDPDDPDCAEPLQDIAVHSYVGHPHYERANVLNDIGLVRLSEAAKFTQKNIKPVCLPFSKESQELPKKFVVIGWGRTESSFKSKILQKANLPLYDQESCKQKFSQLPRKNSFVLLDSQFCAGGEGQVDACRGDSGSSLQAIGQVDGRPKMVQYGIVSYGITKCGVEFGFPGVYTKTSSFLNWILDNMQ